MPDLREKEGKRRKEEREKERKREERKREREKKERKRKERKRKKNRLISTTFRKLLPSMNCCDVPAAKPRGKKEKKLANGPKLQFVSL